MESIDSSNISPAINEAESIISTTKNNANSLSKNYFPSDVLKWMKANAKPQMSLKLMQICKYFKHQKFPYFVVKKFDVSNLDFRYSDLTGVYHEWDTVGDIPNNLWITNEFRIVVLPEVRFASRIIPKISVCEAKEITLGYENILLHELKALTSSGTVEVFCCFETYIRDENGGMAPFEDILACVQNIKELYLHRNVPSFSTIEAAKKEWILPNLKHVELRYMDENFNAETFIEFMKNHKTIQFILRFHHSFLFQYGPQLQAFVDEIISAADLRYPPPRITFTLQTTESKAALEALQQAYNQQ